MAKEICQVAKGGCREAQDHTLMLGLTAETGGYGADCGASQEQGPEDKQ